MRKFSTSTVIAIEAAIGLSFALYGAYGVINDDLVIPYLYDETGGGVRTSNALHFSGLRAWLLYGGMLMVAAACAMGIVDQRSAPPQIRKRGSNPVFALLVAGFLVMLVMIELKWLALI